MKIILTTLITVFALIQLNAQNAYNYDIDNSQSFNYRNDYRDNHNHYSQYNQRTNYQNRYLPIRVRKDLRKLERKLAYRKECAWEDGHVSRREARRIRKIENDIAKLLYRYQNYGNTSRRSNRYCN